MPATAFAAPMHTDDPESGAPMPGIQPEPARAPVVLIAEDHEDSRDALRTLLEAFGYAVVEARNGAEAVERALATAPDVVLMDMMMPLVDGLEATRRLRASPGFRQVPIVAVTAMDGARERVLEAGCTDFVSKPLEPRRFLERLRGWVEASRAAAS